MNYEDGRPAWKRNLETRRERLAAGEVEVNHGTSSTYTNWGCRCAPCTTAMAVKMKTTRAKRRARNSDGA